MKATIILDDNDDVLCVIDIKFTPKKGVYFRLSAEFVAKKFKDKNYIDGADCLFLISDFIYCINSSQTRLEIRVTDET